MRSDWILDVLTDLKTFARANGMPALAEQLDDTAIVATAELSALGDAGTDPRYDARATHGNHFGGTGAG
ncbi:MAG: hypothetical protein AAGM84_16835 [Pseudomonadota bacterium]